MLQARAFVRGLSLRGKAAWMRYCASGSRPADIPSNPQHVYRHAGWVSWGDWLGTAAAASAAPRSIVSRIMAYAAVHAAVYSARHSAPPNSAIVASNAAPTGA